jgi:hypothetical protein
MAEEQNKNKRRLKKLLNRYRLVVMNDDTLEERFSLSLTPLRVFVLQARALFLSSSLPLHLLHLPPYASTFPATAMQVFAGKCWSFLNVPTR